jgi:hypothetical protein
MEEKLRKMRMENGEKCWQIKVRGGIMMKQKRELLVEEREENEIQGESHPGDVTSYGSLSSL